VVAAVARALDPLEEPVSRPAGRGLRGAARGRGLRAWPQGAVRGPGTPCAVPERPARASFGGGRPL